MNHRCFRRDNSATVAGGSSQAQGGEADAEAEGRKAPGSDDTWEPGSLPRIDNMGLIWV